MDPESAQELQRQIQLVKQQLDQIQSADPDPYFWYRLLRAFFGSLVFGAVGIALMGLGFKVFEWITPRLDAERELAERQNIAVAVVVAALILGLSYIIATAVQ